MLDDATPTPTRTPRNAATLPAAKQQDGTRRTAAQEDAPSTRPGVQPGAQNLPEAALALHLVDQARQAAGAPVLAILRSAPRLTRVAALARAIAPDVPVLTLPPWDVLPYDRASPSPGIVGQRLRALQALAARPAPCLVLTSAAAALQRVRPARDLQPDPVLRPGDPLDLDGLVQDLAARGYHPEERVDEPGTVALRGQTVELFPAGAPAPIRLEVQDGLITALHPFDPLTQRRTGDAGSVALTPATEFPLDPAEVEDAAEALEAAATPASTTPDANPDEAPEDPAAAPAPAPAPAAPPRLVPLFDLLPDAPHWMDPEVPDRWATAHEQALDAFAATQAARRAEPARGVLPRPSRLFLTPAQAGAALTGPRLPPPPPAETLPAPNRANTLIEHARAAAASGATVVVATPTNAPRVAASLQRRGLDAHPVPAWPAPDASPRVHVLELDVSSGLHRPGLLLLPIGPLLRAREPVPSGSAALAETDAIRLGDLVVHEDHGIARLAALRDVDGEERIALEFAADSELLVPAWDLARIWRIGGARAPDRIGGDAWHRRRAELDTEVRSTAQSLAAAAAARAAATAPAIPAQPGAAALARRFPYPLTPDQRAATDAIAADMASGRPMDRLVCGDVGFGKTEVALRAMAQAALAGHQVLIAAPTTVLARQHLETVQRRFAGTGLEVAALIRGTASPEGRAAARAIATGAARIAVGTQGLASGKLRFHNLGLAVIDEEQRFGEDDKRRLAGLAGTGSHRPHLLTMTATPIPRTLQAALVGLRDVSVLLTPPASRQPTRTFVLPWDPVIVREALLREQRRGGQSFLVVPRITDLHAMASELAGLVPELHVTTAHGRLPPDALETAMLGFARGEGDILLATDIIEAGLDIPRANLMIVMGADRFGLAQLHQLRGRVGRGARRGTAYFLTAQGRRLAPATVRRLRTLETLSGLGDGAALAAADMEGRGAGDLFGARQAGHVGIVGTELYQQLLARAAAALRGEPPEPAPPVIRAALPARIPHDAVPEPNLRLHLLRRLSRLTDETALADFADELQDRFGPPAPALQALLSFARLRILCRAAGVAAADLGPQGAALTPADPATLDALAARLGAIPRNGRAVLAWSERDSSAQVARLCAALDGPGTSPAGTMAEPRSAK